MGKQTVPFKSKEYVPPKNPDGTLNLEIASRRAVLTEYDKIKRMASKYLTVSVWLAVELYRFDPDNVLFKKDIFVKESLDEIALQCSKRYCLSKTAVRPWIVRFARWLYEKFVPPVYSDSTTGSSDGTTETR